MEAAGTDGLGGLVEAAFEEYRRCESALAHAEHPLLLSMLIEAERLEEEARGARARVEEALEDLRRSRPALAALAAACPADTPAGPLARTADGLVLSLTDAPLPAQWSARRLVAVLGPQLGPEVVARMRRSDPRGVSELRIFNEQGGPPPRARVHSER